MSRAPRDAFETAVGAWGRPPECAWEPLALLAEGALAPRRAKTAAGALRYGGRRVVAAIDSTRAPGDLADHLGVGEGIPVVASWEEAAARGAKAILVGTSPRGGALDPRHRAILSAALRHGLNVASGMHELLGEDEELAAAASRGGAAIWDLRRPPAERVLPREEARPPGARVVLTVGSDCHVGKMTAALELHRAALARGRRSRFVPTGQTGVFIESWGVAVDRVIGDFLAGVTDAMVRHAARDADWVWVEGQGTLGHPAYSAVSLGLLHGASPDALVLCHMSGREAIDGYGLALPPLADLVRRHEEAASWVRRTRTAGLALATPGLEEAASREAARRAAAETGLPVADCLRGGAGELFDALERSW